MSEPLLCIWGRGRVTIDNEGGTIIYFERGGRQVQANLSNFSKEKKEEAVQWAKETLERMEQPDW